jgi:hypothetical protein
MFMVIHEICRGTGRFVIEALTHALLSSPAHPLLATTAATYWPAMRDGTVRIELAHELFKEPAMRGVLRGGKQPPAVGSNSHGGVHLVLRRFRRRAPFTTARLRGSAPRRTSETAAG